MTVHGALRPVNTSHNVDEHVEGVNVARAAHNSKCVLSRAEYVVRLLVLSTKVNLDVPPLSQRAWTMT
jgi:hypothetical protein